MYAKVFKGAPLGNKNAAGKHKNHKGMHADAIPRTDAQQKSHEKDLASDNWHTKTMAAFRDKSNDSLAFIRQDASEAAKAKPDNPKAGQYMDEVHYASMELKKRQPTKKEETMYAKVLKKEATLVLKSNPHHGEDGKFIPAPEVVPMRGSGWVDDLGVPQKKQ